jgi:hypothetical protein
LGGGIDGLVVPSFPAVLPRLVMIVRIRFDRDSVGSQYTLRVTARQPNGTESVILANIATGAPRHRGPLIGPLAHGVTINLLVEIMHLAVHEPGVYSFDFLVNDAVIGSLEVPMVTQAEVRE